MILSSIAAAALSIGLGAHASRAHHHARGGDHSLRTLPGNKGVIIQMFQWNYDSIATECTRFIGPNGYGYVQVGPPTEHITGDSWWTDYQAVSYKIASKHGDQAQLQDMIDTCHATGVGVIVDTLWNHMSGQDAPGTGVAGSTYCKFFYDSHYTYPGIYDTNDFHHCNTTPSCCTSDGDIQDWNNRGQIQTCELVNLADLATGSEKVRATLATFFNKLLDMGVDGFRIDAAKHVPVADLKNIIGRLKGTKSGKPIYYSQEVVYEGTGPITSSEYVSIGEVEEFRYPDAIFNAFNNGNLASLQNMEAGWLDSSAANVFVANHDRERNGALNYKSANNMYILANVFSLSYPYGSPTILSSYAFSDTNAGAPNGGTGVCSGTGPTNGWECQHTWTGIAGMVGFFNTVKGTSLQHWLGGSAGQISFFRGSSGFVAINNDGSTWTLGTLASTLPAGTYCDVVSGKVAPNGQSCTGSSHTFGSGSALTVPAHGAVAFHVNAKVTKPVVQPIQTQPQMIPVTFSVKEATQKGDKVYVVGNAVHLGNWDITKAFMLSSSGYTASKPVWHGTISLPNANTEYKYVRVPAGKAAQWESIANRKFSKTAAKSLSFSQTFNKV